MDETAAAQWQVLFARNEQWRREREAWERSQGRPVFSDRLPSGPFAPATEAQIAREEARLGVRLPPSLRSFYLTSNGYGMACSAIWTVRSVEQIGWLRDVVPFLYDIVFEDDPAVGRSLVVSGESDAAWWLLDPGDADERGEWPGGRWASWHPGMSWMAKDFMGLFEAEVSLAERVLAREKFPPPPLGTGRSRNELTIGYVDRPIESGQGRPRNGYTYVPGEGFTSVVT
ncbi:MAG TPA: SMI1/KNR4 family protein, partial [Steroidobacter sp.]